MPAYELSDSSREEIASAAKAQMRKHGGGTAESEVAFKKFSAIYLEMLADPVPTAQEMWDRIQALYQGKYFMYPSFEGGFRALNEAAAEMGLTIDEEQGDA
jgi:hypothetical protein